MKYLTKTLLFLLVISFTASFAALIEPDLIQRFAALEQDAILPIQIYLREQADPLQIDPNISNLPKPQRRARVGRILIDFAERTQRDLINYLKEKEAEGKVRGISPLWIVNAVGCGATREVVYELATRDDIALIYYDMAPVKIGKIDFNIPSPPADAVEPNIVVVNARGAWKLGYTGQNIVIGVVDTGVRYTHDDLENHLWTSTAYPNCGFNIASNQYTKAGHPGPSPYDTLTPLDYYGHGTHCAGIAAADGTYGNGTRDTMGVAPSAKIMSVPVDVYIHSPYPDTTCENSTMHGMQFCVRPPRDTLNGADVITMSLGLISSWLPRYAVWRNAERNILIAGIPHIVAAGNEGTSGIRTPGNCPPPWRNPANHPTGPGHERDTCVTSVITVGATDNNDNIAYFSSRGPTTIWGTTAPFYDYENPPGLMDPDVCAPGVNILSTYYSNDRSYTTMSGTSMATPHVAGCVALMLSKNPYLTPKQIDSILELHAVRDLGSPGKDNTFGAGRINCSLAVAFTPPPIMHDVGVTTILSPTGTIDSTASVTPACTVYNYGNQTETYTVRMKVGTFYNGTANVSGHSPGTKRYVTFAPIIANWPRGTWAITCTTELSGDMNPSNDKRTGSVTVRVRDVGTIAITAPTGTIDSTASVTPACTVYNFGTTTEGPYTVRMKIGDFYDNTANVSSHSPGTKLYITFPSLTDLPRGTHTVSCSTELADMVPENDKITGSFTVQVRDVGTIEILSPPASVDSGEVITPQAKVKNFGTRNETFDVTFIIEGPLKWSSTKLVSDLAPDEERIIDFDPWTAQPRGTFVTKCTTQLAGDMNPTNDKIEADIVVSVRDVGTTEIIQPVGNVDSTTSITPKAKVKNFGSLNANFDVTFFIEGPTKWSSTKTVTDLAPDEEREIEFDAWQVSGRGNYTARCTTQMSDDMIPNNDKLERTFSIRVKDCGVVSFVLPYDNMTPGNYNPQVKFKNFGTEVANFTAKVIIGEYVGTATINNLYPNVQVTTSFDPVWTAEVGNYTAICSLFYTGDMILENNTLSLNFKVRPLYVGWVRMADLNGTKPVKSGGCITAFDSLIYGLIGNNTLDFMRYSINGNSWSRIDSVPKGPRGKRVKKGACITNDGTGIYVVKGNNTKEFYRYNPATLTWDSLPEPTFTKGIKGGFACHLGNHIYLGSGSNNNEWQRFNITTGLWEACEPATLPAEKFKVGSSIVSYEDTALYLLRAGGKTNEFYYLNLNTSPLTWTRKQDLPLVGEGGRKKKVKEGASLVYANADRKLYCIKGGNTLEFWQYNPTVDSWYQKEDVGKPSGTPAKRIKGGGSLAYSSYVDYIYATIGNNTNEFWLYGGPFVSGFYLKSSAMGEDHLRQMKLSVVPNPTKGEIKVYWTLPTKEKATLSIYTVLGEKVINATSEKGSFRIRDLPAGIYILRFTTKGYNEERKLIVVK